MSAIGSSTPTPTGTTGRYLDRVPLTSGVSLLRARDLQLVVPDGAGDELLRGRARVEGQSHLLRTAIRVRHNKRDGELRPFRHRPRHHRSLGDRVFRAGETDAPLQPSPAHQLALVLALEHVA